MMTPFLYFGGCYVVCFIAIGYLIWRDDPDGRHDGTHYRCFPHEDRND